MKFFTTLLRNSALFFIVHPTNKLIWKFAVDIADNFRSMFLFEYFIYLIFTTKYFCKCISVHLWLLLKWFPWHQTFYGRFCFYSFVCFFLVDIMLSLILIFKSNSNRANKNNSFFNLILLVSGQIMPVWVFKHYFCVNLMISILFCVRKKVINIQSNILHIRCRS